MSDRSNRREVRNPVLSLPSVKRLDELSPEARAVIADILGDLVIDARTRAQQSWAKNKGPMAAYWKAVGAYAHHFRRVVRCPPPQPRAAVLFETENRPEGHGIEHISVLSSDLETLSVNNFVGKDLLGNHLASSQDGFIVGDVKRGKLQTHRVLLENIVSSDVEIVSGHAASVELSPSNRNEAPRFQSSPLPPAQREGGAEPLGSPACGNNVDRAP
ncbi:hypothetical protein [Rhizobium sp. Root1240]|uniref:hypothetical protein n=1 Tax=Rhizobium sp. Root1240 TaxID=1736437 RepID=UPI000A63DD26|nr:MULTISPECIES: hypothetical protein [unclassified Rhizobium]